MSSVDIVRLKGALTTQRVLVEIHGGMSSVFGLIFQYQIGSNFKLIY